MGCREIPWERGDFFKSDERILGDSDFVANVLAKADEAMDRKSALAAQGVDLNGVIHVAVELVSLPPEQIAGLEKSRDKVRARSLICYWGPRNSD